MIRYIIVGNQRSGTSAVHLALKGHPEVSALNDEIGIKFFNKGISAFTNGYNSEAENKFSQLLLFDALTQSELTQTTKASGMKIAIDKPANAKLFIECVREKIPGVKIILTYRTDFTAQYGSLMLAKKTGKWHSWVNMITEQNIMINFDALSYTNYLLNCITVVDEIKKLATSHDLIVYNYETDLMSCNFEKLFDFIGVSKLQINWFVPNKISPPPENYIKEYHRFQAKTKYFLENRNDLLKETEKNKVYRIGAFTRKYFQYSKLFKRAVKAVKHASRKFN